MQEYFAALNGQPKGPFTIDELRNAGIQFNTLIWCKGLGEWKNARDIPELNGFFEIVPPPIPLTLEQKKNLKYDMSYPLQKYLLQYAIVGIVMFGLSNYFIFKTFNQDDYNYFSDTADLSYLKYGILILSFAAKIAVGIKCSRVAKEMNRDEASYGLAGFFFPSITLIIMSFKKKLKI